MMIHVHGDNSNDIHDWKGREVPARIGVNVSAASYILQYVWSYAAK